MDNRLRSDRPARKQSMVDDPINRKPLPVVLTVAGSDSGGGAGIQADLKTFAAMGCFGTSAVTCLTAQNPDRIEGIEPVPPAFVALQMRMVFEGFDVAAVKTGMLYSESIVGAVSAALDERPTLPLVVDPVMVATSGKRLLREKAVERMVKDLLPRATVVTPNTPEAERLTGRTIRTEKEMEQAAREIAERYGCACVIKGGHLAGETITDVLYAKGVCLVERSSRVGGTDSHGTGCTFAAALAAALAHGADLADAFRSAREFVANAIRHARPAGGRHPLNPLFRLSPIPPRNKPETESETTGSTTG